jgi:hypothetical protein
LARWQKRTISTRSWSGMRTSRPLEWRSAKPNLGIADFLTKTGPAKPALVSIDPGTVLLADADFKAK